MKKTFGRALVLFFIMTVLCGLIYPMVITGISQLFFHEKANGSIIEIDGVKYGSTLLGQQYSDAGHMWGRIMLPEDTAFATEEGELLFYGGASNLSPAGEAFEEAVAERVAMLKAANPGAGMEAVPVELVTCSGSGLDPHISPAAAEYQIPRVAEATGRSEAEVREIVEKCTDRKFLGILGEETVNVLEVNLRLDGILTEE